jgi:transposase-like protein
VNVIEIFQSFQTQEQAIEYLEKVRWGDTPYCPYCGSFSVGRHASGDRSMARWQCRDCTRAFAVTVGTLFHGTHIPLRNWFIILALMLNAKKSASSYQIARDTGMRRATVWSVMHRIRAAMAADPDQDRLLHGIVEADETYVGGKRRRPNNRDDDNGTGKSAGFTGRGTKKVPVAGAVERGGRVIARVVDSASRISLERFIGKAVDAAGTLLITDEWSGYGRICKTMNHAVIRHKQRYADGLKHTNTIEGFWSLVKRAWYGSHHHYSRKYMPLYIAEACYKYNRRASATAWGDSMRAFVGAVA